MLVEGLTAVAAAGGAGIVQAAGTDAWTTLRARVARLLGRGRQDAERTTLERLDRTREALEGAEPPAAAEVAARHEASWQTRFEDFLESLEPGEQTLAVQELRDLLAPLAARVPPTVHAVNSGVTAGGDITNDNGAIGRDFGGPVTIGPPDRPTPPGPDHR